MALMSPELIFVSYSCALRDHIVRLTRARPVRMSSERFAASGSDIFLIPTAVTFEVGTRSVILSFEKLITKSSSLKPWRWPEGFRLFEACDAASETTAFCSRFAGVGALIAGVTWPAAGLTAAG